MKYEGKVYAKINGRYIECTQTIEDLENEIKYKQCMYCEKTVEYSSGVFVCKECSDK